MSRRRRGRLEAPPPSPPGMVWDVDEWVPAEKYGAYSRREMAAFDSLPESVKRELRRTGEDALAYLELQRRRRERDW